MHSFPTEALIGEVDIQLFTHFPPPTQNTTENGITDQETGDQLPGPPTVMSEGRIPTLTDYRGKKTRYNLQNLGKQGVPRKKKRTVKKNLKIMS